MDEEVEGLLDPQSAVRELMGTGDAEETAIEPKAEAAPIAEDTEDTEATELQTTAEVTQDELLKIISQASPEERQQILADAREQALTQRVNQIIDPYRDQLQERIDSGVIDVQSANELLEARTEATMERMARQDAQAQAQETEAKATQDAFFGQVTSEFPGADVETLRLLAGTGLDANTLRTVAARQSEQIKKATQTAVSKYVAAKGQDMEAFVPATGDASRPTGEDVLDENSSYGELMGLYKKGKGS